MVEKRWRGACKTEKESSGGNDAVFPLLPSDSELAAAFVDRKRRSDQPAFILLLLFRFFGCIEFMRMYLLRSV